MRCVAGVGQLVERHQQQRFKLRIRQRTVQHTAEHKFQAACVALHAVGKVLQHAFVLRRQIGMRPQQRRQFVGKITAFANGNNGLRGQFLNLGKGHGRAVLEIK